MVGTKGGVIMKLLTVKETAERLGISPRTIYNCIHKGAERSFPIKPVRLRRCVRFLEDDVNKFIKSL